MVSTILKTVFLLTLIVSSTSAFASKARLLSLGESIQGSFYVPDTRNIFLNPAYLAQQNKFITFEWGEENQQAPSFDATDDTDLQPHAEGGGFATWGSMIFGVYLGATDIETQVIRRKAQSFVSTTTATADLLYPDDNIDFFLALPGEDFDVGLNLKYSHTNNAQNPKNPTNYRQKQELLISTLGFRLHRFSLAPSIYLKDYVRGSNGTSGSPNDNYEPARLGWKINSSLELGNFTLFTNYHRRKWLTQRNVNNGKAKAATSRYRALQLGVGYRNEHSKQLTIYSSFQMQRAFEVHFLTTGSAVRPNTVEERTIWTLPLTIGIEHNTFDWLKLRCSIIQEVYGKTNGEVNATTAPDNRGKSKTNDQTTNVNAGVTLLVKGLEIDGLIGTGNTAAATATTTNDERGLFSTDRLLTRVALTYGF